MSAHKPTHFIHASPQLQRWKETSELLRKYQRALEAIAPREFGGHCMAGALSEGTLCLYASNGATAAKLRQRVPTLLTGLRNRGLEITAIRVLVQAAPPPRPREKPEKNPIGDKALDEMEQFTGHLESSPLKGALEKLLAHQRNRKDAGKA
jgi:Uncharacterized protein conserved in bacteria